MGREELMSQQRLEVVDPAIAPPVWAALRNEAEAAAQNEAALASLLAAVIVGPGTGIVGGVTAVIGDDVAMLQGVTLGGTGAERGDRHPKIGKGVLLGAGAKVLGNIAIGDYAKIASGSVVLKPVPAGCTAAGVPARLVNCPTCDEPAKSMDHTLADAVYDYVI